MMLGGMMGAIMAARGRHQGRTDHDAPDHQAAHQFLGPEQRLIEHITEEDLQQYQHKIAGQQCCRQCRQGSAQALHHQADPARRNWVQGQVRVRTRHRCQALAAAWAASTSALPRGPVRLTKLDSTGPILERKLSISGLAFALTRPARVSQAACCFLK